MGSEVIVLFVPLGIASLASLVYGFRPRGKRLYTFALLAAILAGSIGVIAASGGSIATFSVVIGVLLTLAGVVAGFASIAIAGAKGIRAAAKRVQ